MRLERGTPPNKWVARVVIGLALLNIVAGWLGDLFLSFLVDDDPLTLIALSPRDRNLALMSPQLDFVPFFVVGFVRLVFFDPWSYLLGFWYGDRALAWMKRRSRTYGPLMDDAQAGFKRYAAPLIVFFPNNVICMLAGASGIGVGMFVALNAFGTAARLLLIRQFGNIFSGQLNSVTDWISDYRIPIFLLSAVLIGWTVVREFGGEDSEVKALIDLEMHPEAEVGHTEPDQAGTDHDESDADRP